MQILCDFLCKGLEHLWILVSSGGGGGVLEALCHMDTQGCLEQQTLRKHLLCARCCSKCLLFVTCVIPTGILYNRNIHHPYLQRRKLEH